MLNSSPLYDLKTLCQNTTNTDGDDFVGIKFEWNTNANRYDIHIRFPLGYRIGDDHETIRKDILLLIQTLTTYGDKQSVLFDSRLHNTQKNISFPIQAYLNIMYDYLNRGNYYIEKDEIYTRRTQGKINWNHTIRKEKPIIQNNGIAYLTMQVRKYNDTDKNLITEINRFCVYDSFLRLGWLYNHNLPAKPTIAFNKNLFISTLHQKLANTHKDKDKKLFQSMLDIVNFVDTTEQNHENYDFGTTQFEYIWEKLVDDIFGISNKQDFFPKAEWQLYFSDNRQSSALQPDTILQHHDMFVLDAKYYRYGITAINSHLPNSASINKQITYGEYIFNKFSEKGKNFQVYNAFLMPFSKSNQTFSTTNNYLAIGKANSNWKKNSFNYEIVLGILADTKHLMSLKIKPNKNEIVSLADTIKKNY